MKKEPKIRKTFTVDKHIYAEFTLICDTLAMSKSKFLENRIKDFIEKNKEV